MVKICKAWSDQRTSPKSQQKPLLYCYICFLHGDSNISSHFGSFRVVLTTPTTCMDIEHVSISLVVGFMSKEAEASISRWVWKSCQERPQSVCWRRDLIKSLHILHIWTDKVCTVENVLGKLVGPDCWCVGVCFLVSIFELLMFISFALLYLFRTLVVQLCCSALAPKATCFIWFHLEPSPLKRMSKRLHRYFQKHSLFNLPHSFSHHSTYPPLSFSMLIS